MNKRKFMIIFLSFIILFTLTILFVYNNSFAIFKTGRSGSSLLGTAAWNVSAGASSNTLNLVAGGQAQSYTLTVTNNSEVDVTYSIQFTNLPTGMKVGLDGDQLVTEVNNTVTFASVGGLSYTSPKTRNHTVTFQAPQSSSETSNWQIHTSVTFKQATS